MIRKFEPRDIEPVMQIWLRGNLQAHSFVPAAYWEQDVPLVREQLLQAEVYVYEAEGGIQGFAGLQADYLAGIFVKQSCRSKGIGRQLLAHVKQLHPSLTLNVYQKNRRAAAFYRREGFSLVSEATDEATGEIDCTMRWRAGQS